MNKKYLLVLSLVLALTSCAGTPVSHYEGYCSHPAVMGGMPFPISPETKVEGNNLIVKAEDGATMVLIGAQCLLSRTTGKPAASPKPADE